MGISYQKIKEEIWRDYDALGIEKLAEFFSESNGKDDSRQLIRGFVSNQSPQYQERFRGIINANKPGIKL